MKYIIFFVAGALGGFAYAMIEDHLNRRNKREPPRDMIKDDTQTDDRLPF